MVVSTLEQRWEILRQIDIQKMPNLAKKIIRIQKINLQKMPNHFFRWSSFWYWRVCKQAKLSHLGHKKPTRIYWKADAPKTGYCLARILVKRHNWAIFLRKWVRRGRYTQWKTLSVNVERIFVHKYWRGGYWKHFVSTGRRYVPHTRSYTRCFARYWLIIRRADVVWLPRICDLTPLGYCLWGAVKYMSYAEKPETIDVLKDNIRKAIDEI